MILYYKCHSHANDLCLTQISQISQKHTRYRLCVPPAEYTRQRRQTRVKRCVHFCEIREICVRKNISLCETIKCQQSNINSIRNILPRLIVAPYVVEIAHVAQHHRVDEHAVLLVAQLPLVEVAKHTEAHGARAELYVVAEAGA